MMCKASDTLVALVTILVAGLIPVLTPSLSGEQSQLLGNGNQVRPRQTRELSRSARPRREKASRQAAPSGIIIWIYIFPPLQS